MKATRLTIAWLALYAVQATAQTDGLKVWMDMAQAVTADGETVTYLTVNEKDPSVSYIAYNMTITLPKGFRVNKVEQGGVAVDDITLSERATDTHQIECNMADESKLKVICTSTGNQEMDNIAAGDNGGTPVFKVGLVADPTTVNGTYDVGLTDVRFVRHTEDGTTLAAVDLTDIEQGQLTVTGGAVGINSVKDGNDEPVNVYDTGGKLIRQQITRSKALDGLAPGIYVIKGKKHIVR